MLRIMNRLFAVILFFCVALFLSSCVNSGNAKSNYVFAGNWQGSGVDSEGNIFNFSAKVIALGDNHYRFLVLDKLDTQKEPLHIMDGILEDNNFVYTADEGKYVGAGVLENEKFEGYYKGPVDGTYKMHRVKKLK